MYAESHGDKWLHEKMGVFRMDFVEVGLFFPIMRDKVGLEP